MSPKRTLLAVLLSVVTATAALGQTVTTNKYGHIIVTHGADIAGTTHATGDIVGDQNVQGQLFYLYSASLTLNACYPNLDDTMAGVATSTNGSVFAGLRMSCLDICPTNSVGGTVPELAGFSKSGFAYSPQYWINTYDYTWLKCKAGFDISSIHNFSNFQGIDYRGALDWLTPNRFKVGFAGGTNDAFQVGLDGTATVTDGSSFGISAAGPIINGLTNSIVRLPQGGLIAEFLFDEGAGRLARNNVYPRQPNYNRCWPPEQGFASTWGGVPVDNDTENPLGDYTATHINLGAGGNMYRDFYDYTIGATYTLSLYIKSATNSVSQTFKIAGATGFDYSDEITVSAGWQRCSYTFVASSARYLLPIQAVTDLNAYLWGIQLEVGSKPTTYVPLHFDQMLGNNGDPVATADPTWTSRGLFFNTDGPRGTIQQHTGGPSWQPAVFDRAATVYSVFRRQGVLHYPTYAPIMNSDNPGGTFTFWGGAPNECPELRLCGTSVTATDLTLNDQKWHFLAATIGPTNGVIYLDDLPPVNVGLTAGQSVINQIELGVYPPAFFAGDLSYASIYNVTHSPVQVASSRKLLTSLMASRGVTLPAVVSDVVAFTGDSIMGSVYLAMLTNGVPVQSKSFAAGGAQVSTMVAMEPQINVWRNSARHANIAAVLLGANDLPITTNAVTATNFVVELKSYCTDLRTNGWKVVLSTVLPQKTEGFLYNRNIANSLIVADPSFYDRIARVDTNAFMGLDSCASNLTYYSGYGVHPTPEGYGVLAPIIKTEIDYLLTH